MAGALPVGAFTCRSACGRVGSRTFHVFVDDHGLAVSRSRVGVDVYIGFSDRIEEEASME